MIVWPLLDGVKTSILGASFALVASPNASRRSPMELVLCIAVISALLIVGALALRILSHPPVATVAVGPLTNAPFDMASNFFPSGWIGDGEIGSQYVQFLNAPCGKVREGDSDGVCATITYRKGPNGWAGMYWQYPDGTWGDEPGRTVVGATKLTFWAAGARGGEIVTFKVGGIRNAGKPYRDTLEVSTGPIVLAPEWRRYELSLEGRDLSSVIGGFAWSAAASSDRDSVFYLDDIRYE